MSAKSKSPGNGDSQSAAFISARRRASIGWGLWGCVFIAAGALPAWGQAYVEQQKLTTPERTAGDAFGYSVTVSGDTVIVGASGDDCCGSAYVFRFDGTTWVEEQRLTASDEYQRDRFGGSASLSGSTAVLGATGADCASGGDCGAAYVFQFNGTDWVEAQKLIAEDAERYDHFGVSVSVSGDTVLVGAPENDCADGVSCGSAYVFRFDGTRWVQEQKLTAYDEAQEDSFGNAVSVNGDTALVGARTDDCGDGHGCGSAYIFRFDGGKWVFQQKLKVGGVRSSWWFGESVSLGDGTAVVGSPGDNCAQSECGSVYVFRFDGTHWVQTQKLTASDGGDEDYFGSSVSLSGNTIVAGASDECATGNRCGSAYVFHFNGDRWVETQKLTASDRMRDDWFGLSVSVSGDTVIAGAYRKDCDAGEDCGAAYVFREVGCVRDPVWECDGDTDGDGQVNPVDSGLVQAAFGSADEADLCQYDMDCDGQINPVDAGIVQSLFGTCNEPRAACP